MRADILLRQGLRPREWRLYPDMVELIWRRFGQADVEPFALQETNHCLLWFFLTHLAPVDSALKVYVTAIVAFHLPLSG